MTQYSTCLICETAELLAERSLGGRDETLCAKCWSRTYNMDLQHASRMILRDAILELARTLRETRR